MPVASQIQLSQRLHDEIERRVSLVQDYVLSHETVSRFAPEDMREAVTCYFASGGKRLRPAVLLFCCGAVGGDESKAISVAAATEIFHTWTLVHDDIIDRDPVRRGQLTVHERFARKPSTLELFGAGEAARHYGISVAVLAGDVQHGWGISLMTELTRKFKIDPSVTLALINELDTRVLCTLVEGEMLDVQYSRIPIERLTVEQIESMLWKKTGALYEFCGTTGAMIGLETSNLKHPLAVALAEFCSSCGSAFQLQDDILGLIGNEQTLGKPVGADIREGKRTVIVRHAYENASAAERKQISSMLGNPDLSREDTRELVELLIKLDGVRFTAERARSHVNRALGHLADLPATGCRELLAEWAQFMIEREF